jgi:hypothetical protein
MRALLPWRQAVKKVSDQTFPTKTHKTQNQMNYKNNRVIMKSPVPNLRIGSVQWTYYVVWNSLGAAVFTWMVSLTLLNWFDFSTSLNAI